MGTSSAEEHTKSPNQGECLIQRRAGYNYYREVIGMLGLRFHDDTWLCCRNSLTNAMNA